MILQSSEELLWYSSLQLPPLSYISSKTLQCQDLPPPPRREVSLPPTWHLALSHCACVQTGTDTLVVCGTRPSSRGEGEREAPSRRMQSRGELPRGTSRYTSPGTWTLHGQTWDLSSSLALEEHVALSLRHFRIWPQSASSARTQRRAWKTCQDTLPDWLAKLKTWKALR